MNRRCFFETPGHVGELLSQHLIPRKRYRVLDPAVGNGALVTALASRFDAGSTELTVVDISQTALQEFESSVSDIPLKSLRIHHNDFLSTRCLPDDAGLFNLIIMNPPFSGRLKKMRRVRWRSGKGEFEGYGKGPVEAAFLASALSYLEPGGQLLAVLPASVISSQRSSQLRKKLLEEGTITFVQELSAGTFGGAQGRSFAFGYVRGRVEGSVQIGQRLTDGRLRTIDVPPSKLLHGCPLNYEYQSASREFGRLRQCTSLGWKRLGAIADITRGPVSAPNITSWVVHSTSIDGLRLKSTPRRCSPRNSTTLVEGDLVVPRVGRNVSRRLAVFNYGFSSRFSDCVVRIRPAEVSWGKCLFALRVVMGSELHALVQRPGTGASYLSIEAMRELQIPIDLNKAFDSEFKSWCAHLQSSKFDEAISIEKEVAVRLGLGSESID